VTEEFSLTSTGLDGWIADLDRLADGHPRERATERLDHELSSMFAEATGLIHVESGELRASGRTSSHVEESSWHGEMRWTSPHAVWHWQDNDYLRLAHLHEEAILDAMRDEL
jgi:hypothetical protein